MWLISTEICNQNLLSKSYVNVNDICYPSLRQKIDYSVIKIF